MDCPVCLEVFEDPVVLSCSHSFCKTCLQRWWTEKINRECPVCKRHSSRTDPPCNLALKNLCETFAQQLTLGQASEDPVPLCPQHKEKLKLFCVDHKQPVCLICRDSKAHNGHKFRPVDEMALECREKLRKSLKPLQDRWKKYDEVRLHWDRTCKHIKQQGQHTEKLIRTQFDQIRAFLQREEQARITALRTEVEQKSSLMEQRLASLKLDMAALSESITQAERELLAPDMSFLQGYSSAEKQVQQVFVKSVPDMPSGSLVDVAKHLGNLGFHIWDKMKEMVSYIPVVLDPNTANPFLVVSDDLSCVQFKLVKNNALPDNPERFSQYFTVLGSEGYSSGTHSWEVDVQNDGRWAVGVKSESTPRKQEITVGHWEIWLKEGRYTAYAHSLVHEVITLKQPLQRIRVDLYMDEGKVTFSDAKTAAHIYTFIYAFKDKIFPFINTFISKDTKIAPVKIKCAGLKLNIQRKQSPHVYSCK